MNCMDMMIEEYKMLWEEIHKLEEELKKKEKIFIELGGTILEELMKENSDVLMRLKER